MMATTNDALRATHNAATTAGLTRQAGRCGYAPATDEPGMVDANTRTADAVDAEVGIR